MVQKTFGVFAASFLGLIILTATVALFRNVYFVWVNDTRAIIGQYILAGMLLGVVVFGIRLAARKMQKGARHGA